MRKCENFFENSESGINGESTDLTIIQCKFYSREVDGIIGIILQECYGVKAYMSLYSDQKRFIMI